jgi:hypothetical protein
MRVPELPFRIVPKCIPSAGARLDLQVLGSKLVHLVCGCQLHLFVLLEIEVGVLGM